MLLITELVSAICLCRSFREERRLKIVKDGLHICVADIRNKIFEAGLLKPDERIVLVAGSCVLLEHFTGKKYSYRMVDLCTMNPKHLFTRRKPLTESGHQRAAETMLAQASIQGRNMELKDSSTRARELLTHIFCDILPEHGMVLRENQHSLACSILDAMEKRKVALCEAEVGTGKTHAYIVAAVLYRLFHLGCQPAVISTSTVALQKALTEEYIPQISAILLEHHILQTPLTCAVRKGKNHYACDSRVKTYMSSIRNNNCLEDQELLEILMAVFTGGCPVDLDSLPVTSYVKKRICVERCQRTCRFSGICRYRTFVRRSGNPDMDFLVVNHNLVLADVLSQKSGRDRLFPECCVLIFDESHKLMETARQMYGVRLERMEIERLAINIRRAACTHPDKSRMILMCEEIRLQNSMLFESIESRMGTESGYDYGEIRISSGSVVLMNSMIRILKHMSMTFYSAEPKTHTHKRISSRIDRMVEVLLVLKDYEKSIYWLETTGPSASCLCSLPRQLDNMLYEDIWKGNRPCILTSATMSVDGDFTRFMGRSGVDLLGRNRLLTVSKASPFDYQNHALLYLPADMPFPNVRSRDYMEAVLERLERLIRQTWGHTLVLFTSYRMMEDTYRRLVDRTRDYPVFTMGKGRLEAMEAFRKSGNGVLLASDSAGEGIDLAGDILAALPDMPVTDQIGDVGSFILDHKGKSYFRRAQGIGQGEELI